MSNLGLSCDRCNRLKADATDDEFLLWLLSGGTDHLRHRRYTRELLWRLEWSGARLALLHERHRNHAAALARGYDPPIAD